MTSSGDIGGCTVLERRHPAVQWLLENKPLMPLLKVLSVMTKLDWAAIQQLILVYDLTALTCANLGPPPDMPPSSTVIFNGLVGDPAVAGRWVSASICTAAGRVDKRCEKVPSFRGVAPPATGATPPATVIVAPLTIAHAHCHAPVPPRSWSTSGFAQRASGAPSISRLASAVVGGRRCCSSLDAFV